MCALFNCVIWNPVCDRAFVWLSLDGPRASSFQAVEYVSPPLSGFDGVAVSRGHA